jgi:hypothetical protein
MAKHDIDPVMQQLAQPIKESGQGAVPIVISVRGAVLTGALIAEQTCFSEPRRGESLMRALEPSSGPAARQPVALPDMDLR